MRLLVIEDQIKLAKSLKKTLESLNFAVDIFHDGESGYEAGSIESYDCIILDIGLPVMNGLEVCQKLRNEGNQTPIIMLTARDTVTDKITGLNHGADDYLVKPFEFDELLARIRALIRRHSGQKNTLLTIDNLSLDTKSQTVTRAGKQIHLSAKEYTLLNYFMHHPNEVLSKSVLLDHVWGSGVDPFSHVVDVYIGYLRKKIDKKFPDESPLIHTIKGSGYKIDTV